MRPLTLALAALALGLASAGARAAEPAGAGPGEVPVLVPDETAGDWVVDRFAGNSTAGGEFFQGPAAEVGGIGRPAVAVAPDGAVYLAVGRISWLKDRIVRVSRDGALRLLAGGGTRLADGPAATAKIAVDWRGCALVWSKKDASLYFVHPAVPAVRRLYQKDGQWFVETVAGDPQKEGKDDGPARSALFGEPRSVVITADGTIYVLDGSALLRKIQGGQVSTVAKFASGRDIVDGPLDKATFNITRMSGQLAPGETDDVIYVADHWNFAARRIDLKTMTVSTVAISENRDSPQSSRLRRPTHADGPALTHATFNSGLAYVAYDPVHKALWVGGPDEFRIRWVRDGWVRTVIGAKGADGWPVNDLNTPADRPRAPWNQVSAVDAQGRAYFTIGGADGVWRAANRKEVMP